MLKTKKLIKNAKKLIEKIIRKIIEQICFKNWLK